jgi:alkylation response protein AidB-like acyl-CoA dehydrogenase
MTDYFAPAMHLYLDRLVDWGELLRLRGDGSDVETEVGAYRSVLETTAALAESFERPARENWHVEAELTKDGDALSPKHIRDAYEQLREAGLISLTVDEEYGGPGLPALINGMYLEMLSRADTSLMTVLGLQAGAAGDIQHYGDEELKKAYLPRFASGEVQGCMDLTEPQAGSDLGGITARADDLGEGRVRVSGQKIFITNGGAEVHLVLARDGDTFDESKGTTNGLSLLLVPRHLPDGNKNGVRVSRLESKLGFHGSPTCEVVFEEALGWRLGPKGKGFRAMLDLMNAARLGVAAQALGLSEAAFHAAAAYAHERQQFGRPIAQQPLVLTMLAKMAVNIEAVRALLYRTFELVDRNAARQLALGRGGLAAQEQGRIAAEVEHDTTRIRLLTPLCKYFATEVCNDLTRDAMQVFGGIGFTMDVDAAKLHADSLVLTVYEGTSEIQASFALREMGKGTLNIVIAQLRSELATMADDPRRVELAKRVDETIGRLEEAAQILFADLPYALLRAKLMAEMVIDAIAATELLRQVGADPSRLDVAEGFIRRRMLEIETMGRRIEENHEGHLERDARILTTCAPPPAA